MSPSSRRDFLAQGALAAALGCIARPGNVRAADEPTSDRGPDLAVVNGVIYTVDDRLPKASAFAVKHGRFVAVGSNDEVRGLATRATRVIDAGGMTVVPGFIDAHCHPAMSGIAELLEVDCNRPTIAEIRTLCASCGQNGGGQWVFGFQYDDTKLKDGGRSPAPTWTRRPKHPVRVVHRGVHRRREQRGLKRADIDRNPTRKAAGSGGMTGERTGSSRRRRMNSSRSSRGSLRPRTAAARPASSSCPS
jgi:predicted amidohydrolase YtcJ